MHQDGPTDDSKTAPPTEPVAENEPRRVRQRAIRDKLQQMYGDDSAETVRRFLHELTGGGADDADLDEGDGN